MGWSPSNSVCNNSRMKTYYVAYTYSRIQNLKSKSNKWWLGPCSATGHVQYFQKVKFHASGYNLRCIPHILTLFFAHGMYLYIFAHRLQWQQPQLSCNAIFMVYSFFISSFNILLSFSSRWKVSSSPQFVVPDLSKSKLWWFLWFS